MDSSKDPEPVFIPPTTTGITSSTPTTPPTQPNISIRTYIYFLPHPLPPDTPVPYTPGLPDRNPLNLPPHAFEPTSTLVLTSPAKTFVDLRYLKPISSPLPSSNAESSAETSRRESLEWGFAGCSFSVPASPPHEVYGAFTENRWMHWLDSRCAVGEEIPGDEGVMFDVGGGLYVEHGHAFHPQLGRVAGHEEGWVDVEPRCTDGGSAERGTQAKKACVVLRCHDDEKGVRGVVVRVGQYVQGIVQVGGKVATERWEYDFDGERGSWKRTARTGEWFLPCAVTWQTERVVVDGKVKYGEFEWVVEECWAWE